MNLDYDPAPRLPLSRGERAFMLVLAAGFLGLLALDLAQGFSIDKLSVVFVIIAWGPLLVLHELGHALAARAVGWQVTEIVIGFGRELTRFRVGATRVRIRALPVEGYVIPSPQRAERARLELLWIYFAGPLADLLVLGLALWALDFDFPGARAAGQSASVGRLMLESVAVTAAIGALCTLFPYRSNGSPSDGLGILASCFQSEAAFRERLCWPFLSEGRRLLLREQCGAALEKVAAGLQQHPEDVRLTGLYGVCQAANGQPDAGFATLESLGPPEARPEGVRAELLADAAWAVLFARDTELALDAQRALERALELSPRDPHALILLGRIHLERGRADEAYRCLMQAYKVTRDADQEAQCVAYLAILCADATASPKLAAYAQRFLHAVAAHDVPPDLAQRVERAVRQG